ncbi:MAG: helix-turn-helix domain-containing protein [Pseudomonadota bacterium]
MSDVGDASDSQVSAGALLRAARQAQGLHIAALATTLKVPPRKLEALEADRYDEFQGATFVRALAQAACRALKIDPTPVLDRLPDIDGGNLSQLERGLNAPFRERGARRESSDIPGTSLAAIGLVVVLLVGAGAFWLLPADWRLPAAEPAASAADGGTVVEPGPVPAVAPSPPASLPTASEPAASVVAPGLPLAPPQARPASAVTLPAPAAPASVPAVLPASAGVLQLRARAASWVEVVDGHSKVLLARTLGAGEVVGLDGVLPLRVKIGNVSGTELSFRGRPVDLADLNRDNVARLELK